MVLLELLRDRTVEQNGTRVFIRFQEGGAPWRWNIVAFRANGGVASDWEISGVQIDGLRHLSVLVARLPQTARKPNYSVTFVI